MSRSGRTRGVNPPGRGWSSLTAFLADHPADSVVLSFDQIESLMKQGLPPSARKYPSVWSNSAKNPYSRHWVNVGFRTTTRDVPDGQIRFLRNAAPTFAPPEASGRFERVAAMPAADPESKTTGLILLGCVKSKRSVASPAKDLYSSPLWVKRRRYAEAAGVPWLILSAAHGVVEPETMLGPYDVTLKNLSSVERRAWAESVVADLAHRLDLDGVTIEIHAGMAYQHDLRPLLEASGARVHYPLRGLSQGEQLSWYGETDRSQGEVVSRPGSASLPIRPNIDVGPVADGVIRLLVDPSRRMTAGDLRRIDPAPFQGPGLYSCWADPEFAAVLSGVLGVDSPSLLYVGQSGAIRWPSGEPSSGTLWNRITRQHFGGAITGSTFRLTLAALLRSTLNLSLSGRDLDRASAERLNAFLIDHLSVAMVPFDDADLLDAVEARVIEILDPPLNLSHVDRSVAHRRRITALRRDVSGRLGGGANSDSADRPS